MLIGIRSADQPTTTVVFLGYPRGFRNPYTVQLCSLNRGQLVLRLFRSGLTREQPIWQKAASISYTVICIQCECSLDNRFINVFSYGSIVLSKTILVTHREGLQACDQSSIPYLLDNWSRLSGEVASPTRWPRVIPPYSQENSWYSLPLETGSTPGPKYAWKNQESKKSDDLTGNRTRDHLPCSIMPKSTMLTRVPSNVFNILD